MNSTKFNLSLSIQYEFTTDIVQGTIANSMEERKKGESRGWGKG